MRTNNVLKVALAQISPVWLDKAATLEKIEHYTMKAAKEGASLVVFGEAILPGYPFWLSLTDGASFDSKMQKEMHAHYIDQSVCIEAGDLNSLCRLAKAHQIHIVCGCVERPESRGGYSLYCSLVVIDDKGKVKNVHRKLMPTYEERLCWSIGDGHGLKTFDIPPFRLGGLNCWENWMPLARTALYALGEDVHIAIWPGNDFNTKDISRFIARESRSFVLSVSATLRKEEISADLPHAAAIIEAADEVLANGGSCIAAPDGEWLIPPLVDKEELIIAELAHQKIREERQNFDPIGHYARPDVTRLLVNRDRQKIWHSAEEE